MEILISGEKQPVMTDSLSFEDEVDNRAVASFAVKDIYNEKEFFRGQPVTIKNNNGEEVFKGYIETTDKRPITNAGSYIHDITCSDMHYLADKRMVAFAEKEVLPGDMVKKIVDDKLEEEGVYYFEDLDYLETTTSDFEEGTLTDVVAVDDGLELDLPAWNEIFAAGQTWREVFE